MHHLIDILEPRIEIILAYITMNEDFQGLNLSEGVINYIQHKLNTRKGATFSSLFSGFIF